MDCLNQCGSFEENQSWMAVGWGFMFRRTTLGTMFSSIESAQGGLLLGTSSFKVNTGGHHQEFLLSRHGIGNGHVGLGINQDGRFLRIGN